MAAYLSLPVYALLFSCTACFRPAYPEDVQCAVGGRCPPEQACDPVDNRCKPPYRFVDAGIVDSLLSLDARPADGDPCQAENCEFPTPACIVDENNAPLCVECDDNTDCTTSSNGPVCSDNYTCGCEEHDECPSKICGYDGVCVKDSEVVYVDGENGADDDPDAEPPVIDCGEMASPCKTIAVGQSKIGADRVWMYLFPSLYVDALNISDATLNLIGGMESRIVTNPGLDSPALTVTGTAEVSVDGINLRTAADNKDVILCQGGVLSLRSVTVDGNRSRAIRAESDCTVTIAQSFIVDNGKINIGDGISIADGASLLVAQSMITGNGGVGVSMEGDGSLVIDRCHILRNGRGGVSISDAEFQVKNNIIAGNGANESAFGGIQITGSAVTGTLGFNTITGNNSLIGVAPSGVACNAAGTSSLTLSNNIVWGNPTDNEPNQVVNSAVCLWSYSVLGSDETTPDDTMGIGAGNLSDDPKLTSDHRLQVDSPCIDAADPAEDTTTVDIDGDQRPIMVKELRKDIGADEFMPTSP